MEREVLSLQQAASKTEVKETEKEASSFVLKTEEPKIPTRKDKREVQEEVVENGLAAEVEKALLSYKLSWDEQSGEEAAGNTWILEALLHQLDGDKVFVCTNIRAVFNGVLIVILHVHNVCFGFALLK